LYGGPDSPEDLGLPPRDLIQEKVKELGVTSIPTEMDDNFPDSARKFWDWCIDWRNEHRVETDRRLRIQKMRREIEFLEDLEKRDNAKPAI
jgi:hypothetical protein